MDGGIDKTCEVTTNDVQNRLNLKKIVRNSSTKIPWKVQRKITESSGELFEEYCEHTSIHGIKYIGEKNRLKIERILWIVVFCLSVGYCGNLIGNIFYKWNETPVIVSFSDTSTHISKIPFPSIVICPEIKTNTAVFKMKDIIEDGCILSDLDDDKQLYADVMLQICDPHVKEFCQSNITANVSNTIFLENLMELHLPMTDSIMKCTFNYNDEPCDEVFSTIVTEEGVCFGFNILDQADIYREDVFQTNFYHTKHPKKLVWSLEEGFTGKPEDNNVPYRLKSAYPSGGLNIIVRADVGKADSLCSFAAEGFKLLIFTPDEIPQASKKFLNIPTNHRISVEVKPDVISTSAHVREYSPQKRHCYFQSERYLRFFKSYTKSKCEIECLTNYTLEMCGCVHFAMPRTNDTPICHVGSTECCTEAKRRLWESDFEKHLDGSELNLPGILDCNCLPTCNTIDYDVSTSQGQFDLSIFGYEELENLKFSVINVFFKDNEFWPSERSRLYGVIDLIANAGGLLALFIGISAISFVEILYFLVICLRNILYKFWMKQK